MEDVDLVDVDLVVLFAFDLEAFGDRVEINEPMKHLDDTEKENKPALAINCEMTENGKNIKKLLESVVKTPLKYVR